MTGFEIIDDLTKAQDILGKICEFAEKTGNYDLELLMIKSDKLICEAIDVVA